MHHLVSLPRPADGTKVELMIDTCWSAGAVGVEELGDRLRAAFTDATVAAEFAERLGGSVAAVGDTTGLDDWRDHAVAHVAGPFRIRPPWLPAATDGLDLCIDPGHAFGSGSHPTTRLALAALADHVRPGDRVLDLGTGSGVLAVAAALLGADVVAVDHDPAAEPAVRANATANGVADQVTVTTGPIAAIGPVDVDVVVLNVTIDIHETVAATVRTVDADRLVIAGVLAGAQAERAAALHGRQPVAEFVEGEWAALVFDHGRSAGPP